MTGLDELREAAARERAAVAAAVRREQLWDHSGPVGRPIGAGAADPSDLAALLREMDPRGLSQKPEDIRRRQIRAARHLRSVS